MIGTLVILPLAGFLELQGSEYTLSDDLLKSVNQCFIYHGSERVSCISVILGGLSWGLGYLGQPHLVIRYMAKRNYIEVKKARTIAILWACLVSQVHSLFGWLR
ncbi:MAG: hypothetical protein CM1200mP10_23060 [Candidatus Neomarinimicrobiota bacterium]|nr:MAG: hypothetical protein CM1200mP10_23060 [Candidatus Neomarinimicrobiota bacterium]